MRWRRPRLRDIRIVYRLLIVNALVVAVPIVGMAFARMHERQLLARLGIGAEGAETYHELAGAIRLLGQWAADHLDGVGSGPTHATCGTVLEARWYCPTCDRTVDETEGEDLRYL